eukprot:327310-Pleurochrysis_carterae.AAC.3
MVCIFRGNRHYVQHSCRSDVSDRVARDIPNIPPSAHTAENECLSVIYFGGLKGLSVLLWCRGPTYIPNLETPNAIRYIAIS